MEHFIRAPVVGYRLTVEKTLLFYAPDVAAILDQKTALGSVMLYIGDGASVVRPLLRRRGDVAIGHASIRAQLEWCETEGITRAAPMGDPSQLEFGISGTNMGSLPASRMTGLL